MILIGAPMRPFNFAIVRMIIAILNAAAFLSKGSESALKLLSAWAAPGALPGGALMRIVAV